MKEKVNREKGQGLIELAVSFTAILLLLGGIVDLGRLFFAYIAIRDAAQEGAVYATYATPKEDVNIRGRVRSSSNNPLQLSVFPDDDIDISINNGLKTTTTACTNDTIEVTVTHHHNFIMPLMSTIAGSDAIPIRAVIRGMVILPPCP